MKKLKTVQILGQKVKINEVKPSDDSHGEYKDLAQTIEVNQGITDEAYRRLLIHESVHAGLDISGISAFLNNIDAEEAFCTLMERFLDDLIRIDKQLRGK